MHAGLTLAHHCHMPVYGLAIGQATVHTEGIIDVTPDIHTDGRQLSADATVPGTVRLGAQENHLAPAVEDRQFHGHHVVLHGREEVVGAVAVRGEGIGHEYAWWAVFLDADGIHRGTAGRVCGGHHIVPMLPYFDIAGHLTGAPVEQGS